MSHQLSQDWTESKLQVWTLNVLQQFCQEVHESWVDESIGNIWIENDSLKVNKHIQFIIDSSTSSHCIVHFMEMTFNLNCLNLGSNLIRCPDLEREGLWIVN